MVLQKQKHFQVCLITLCCFATLLKLSKIYFRFGSCENFVKNSNQLDLRVILFEFVVESILSTYSFNLSLVEHANNCLSFANEISMGRFMWRGGGSTV
jgi:hypothetical protein